MSMPEKNNFIITTRRQFLFGASSLSLRFALANATIYIIGEATNILDGSLVAGAK